MFTIPHTTCKCKCSEECVEFTKAESFELRSHAYLLTTKLGDRSCSGDIMGAVADIKSSNNEGRRPELFTYIQQIHLYSFVI